MGVFRRRIIIESRRGGPGGEARAALEDDFHHFRVLVRHEQGHVTHVEGGAPRHPYTACADARGQLAQLVGMALDAVASSVHRVTDPAAQCTHLLDLAGLAVAAASRGTGRRQYDIEVPDRIDGRTQARLARDGQPLLCWDLLDQRIVGPQPGVDVSLREGFARWALSSGSVDDGEAAVALRRCAVISLGRTKKLDLQIHAQPLGWCYAQQPERAEQALRVVGSMLDFTSGAEPLCASDVPWLAFGDEPT